MYKMGSAKIVNNDFVFRGSDPAGRTVTFSDLDHPHGDGLTLFVVSIEAEEVTARCPIESISGDSGLCQAPITKTPSADQEGIQLSALLIELSNRTPWEGTYKWKSFASELTVTLTTDPLGHVSILLKVQPTPWQPTWSASCTLTYNLGDLAQLGKDLGAWFRNSRPG